MTSIPDEFSVRLAKNEISIGFRKLARRWTTLVVSQRFHLEEYTLAGECSQLFLKAERFGLLSNVMQGIRDAERNDDKTPDDPNIFRFKMTGYEFYRIAGYCDIQKENGDIQHDNEGEEYQPVLMAIKPGLIDDLAHGVFESIYDAYTELPDEDVREFSLNHPIVIELAFDAYSHICEVLAQMISDDNIKPKNGHPGKILTGDELDCINRWLNGKTYIEIDVAFKGKRERANKKKWKDDDARLTIKAAKEADFLVEDTNSPPRRFKLNELRSNQVRRKRKPSGKVS